MSRGYRAIWRDGKLFAEYEGDELVFLAEDYKPPQRSDLAAPGLIRDQTDPFKSMADGKLYDSKSAYRATLRERGLTEIGNEKQVVPTIKPPDRESRRKLLHQQMADVSDREANKVLKQLKRDLTP